MKSTSKRIKLDKTKLFGFSQTSADKSKAKLISAKPMIGSKAAGVKGGGGGGGGIILGAAL